MSNRNTSRRSNRFYASIGQTIRGRKSRLSEERAGPSFDDDAYCIVKPVTALDQSFVVVSLGVAGSLQILAVNCTDATALTKDALARISGLQLHLLR